MKEMMKSKWLLGFVAFILGITYMSGIQSKKMEDTNKTTDETYIAMNLK